MPPGWDGVETIGHIWKVQPELQVVICTAYSEYSWEEIDSRLNHSNRYLILKKPFDNLEVRQLAMSITARAKLEIEMESIRKRMMEASRQAGMAEVATGVLHNVGNVLNSVNVSAGFIVEKLRSSRVQNIGKIAALLPTEPEALARFVSEDENGTRLPGYLAKLGTHLDSENASLQQEVGRLVKNIDHIRHIVAKQQEYTKVSGILELIEVTELIEDALQMAVNDDDLQSRAIVRNFTQIPRVQTDRHKVVQILVNLIQNAKTATVGLLPDARRVTLSTSHTADNVAIVVADNGIGIEQEHLQRIFAFGFSTRKNGHGFGLHSSALAASDLGGSLTAASDGPGCGAVFTLELPICAKP
jgi:C4-dicarboxylate-specific signal transduction histidine kinase